MVKAMKAAAKSAMKVAKKVAKKAMKATIKSKKVARKTIGKRPQRLNKRSLGGALVAELKAKSGRKDISFDEAPKYAVTTIHKVPIEQRAGYPLMLTKGGVDPKRWRTKDDKKVEVDFTRSHWLPDAWGQGVKITSPTFRSTGGTGGILQCYVAPDGKTIYYHKHMVQFYEGRTLTSEDGLNGQIRLAKLQATQAVQLARAQVRDIGTTSSYIGADTDKSFFNLLAKHELKVLPSAAEFHFCVVSARRASKLEGIRDIFAVELQLKDAGVTPTWYVDEGSLAEYKALGLRAVVGGKLTEARNKALQDAAKLGKCCVQMSDDISAWVYHAGPNAKERTDDAMNAAFAAAVRYIVTPVAAARFILAKMRAAEGKQPQLGGVYPLQSCSRTFCSDPFSRKNFVIGDFLVVDKSKVRFDEKMKLKEDYDFTCSHIQAHGSVMRCQRMTLCVKHYANAGGAVATRDTKGVEERRNIEILKTKWPGRFRDNPKRQNEVILRWKPGSIDADDDGEALGPEGPGKKTRASKVGKVKKTALKQKSSIKGLPPASLTLCPTPKVSKSEYIAKRIKQACGRTIGSVISTMQYKGADGTNKIYGVADLRYDLAAGVIQAKNLGKRGATGGA